MHPLNFLDCTNDGERLKRKDKEYEKLRTKKVFIFIRQKKLSQTYNALLDVESAARDSWSSMGEHVPWMGVPIHGCIHDSLPTYSRAPKRLFHPFNSPPPGDEPGFVCVLNHSLDRPKR